MLCQRNVGMVNALENTYADKFAVSLRPRDDHQDELTKYGIESHGVVCIDKNGTTLWKHGDHNMTQEQLDTGVETVLSKL